MKSREEAVKVIQNQLSGGPSNNKGICWHYGVIDLRYLLDFIYESKPLKEEEKLYKVE